MVLVCRLALCPIWMSEQIQDKEQEEPMGRLNEKHAASNKNKRKSENKEKQEGYNKYHKNCID